MMIYILINQKKHYIKLRILIDYMLVNGYSPFSSYSDCNHLDNKGSEIEYNLSLDLLIKDKFSSSRKFGLNDPDSKFKLFAISIRLVGPFNKDININLFL